MEQRFEYLDLPSCDPHPEQAGASALRFFPRTWARKSLSIQPICPVPNSM
jgi:hypothetical protein